MTGIYKMSWLSNDCAYVQCLVAFVKNYNFDQKNVCLQLLLFY